jgi:hypothetical protein
MPEPHGLDPEPLGRLPQRLPARFAAEVDDPIPRLPPRAAAYGQHAATAALIVFFPHAAHAVNTVLSCGAVATGRISAGIPPAGAV